MTLKKDWFLAGALTLAAAFLVAFASPPVWAEVNTVPTPVEWTTHPGYLGVDIAGDTITLTGNHEVSNHTPSAFSYDREIQQPKGDFRDDSIRFSFTATNPKMNGSAVAGDVYFQFAFRSQTPQLPSWDCVNGVFFIVFGDKVQLRINDGTASESDATYFYIDDVHLLDGQRHSVEISIDDETSSIEVVIDAREDRKISMTSSLDDAVRDKFDLFGGYLFLTHYVTANITGIEMVNSREAPVIPSAKPSAKPSEGTERPAPKPNESDNTGLIIGLSVGGGVVILAGLGVAAAFLLRRKRP